MLHNTGTIFSLGIQGNFLGILGNQDDYCVVPSWKYKGWKITTFWSVLLKSDLSQGKGLSIYIKQSSGMIFSYTVSMGGGLLRALKNS